jgi:hypothetical protein
LWPAIVIGIVVGLFVALGTHYYMKHKNSSNSTPSADQKDQKIPKKIPQEKPSTKITNNPPRTNLNTIIEGLNNNQITELDLGYPPIKDGGPNLVRLNNDKKATQISIKKAKELAEAIKNTTTLKKLRLSSIVISDERTEPQPNIKITPNSTIVLDAIKKNQSIECLDLSKNSSSSGWNRGGAWKDHRYTIAGIITASRSLISLNLAKNNIEFAEIGNALQTNTTLRFLNLSNTLPSSEPSISNWFSNHDSDVRQRSIINRNRLIHAKKLCEQGKSDKGLKALAKVVAAIKKQKEQDTGDIDWNNSVFAQACGEKLFSNDSTAKTQDWETVQTLWNEGHKDNQIKGDLPTVVERLVEEAEKMTGPEKK